jgi:predicted ferric reductase
MQLQLLEETPLTGTPTRLGQVRRRTVGLAVAMAVYIVTATVVGLNQWLDAPLFNEASPKDGGVTTKSVWFFAVYLFSAPWALGLSWIAAGSLWSRHQPHKSRAPIALLFAIVGIVMMLFGAMMWGSPLLSCGILWCINPDNHPQPATQFEYGHGNAMMAINGVFIFIVSFLFTVAMIRAAFADSYDDILRQLPFMTKEWRFKSASVGVLLLSVLTVFFIATAYLPNSPAQAWNPWAMAQFAASPAVIPDCSLADACPEYSYAAFVTTSYQINSYTWFNFFPGNVFFYAYLVLMIVIGVALNAFSQTRRFRRRTFPIRLGFATFVVPVVSIAGWLLTLCMLALFGVYWFHDHCYNGASSSGSPALPKTEHAARGFGQLAVAFLSLLFFPVTRTSIVHRVLGTSPDSFAYAHRVLGYGMLLAVILHVAMWWRRYRELDLPIPFLKVPTMPPVDPSVGPWATNFTIPVQEICAYTLIVCMGVLAFFPVRRYWFELFKYTHLFAAYAIIPATFYHASAGWEYMLPGLTVYLVDRFIRLGRSGRHVKDATITCVAEHHVRIEFKGAFVDHAAGQYAYINIPAISLFEWHPFTISSAPGDEIRTIHVRSMGPDSFSGRLRTLAEIGGGVNVRVELFVDGPVGLHDHHFGDYDTVVLVAGGVGITPCASLINDSVKRNLNVHLVLVWILRSSDTDLFRSIDIPQAVAGSNCSLEVHCYITGVTKGGDDIDITTHSNWRIAYGRPHWDDVFSNMRATFSPGNNLMFICGPPQLETDAKKAGICRIPSLHTHTETFEL